MEKEMKDWKTGDMIALVFGFDYLKARVLGNNGTHITWSSFDWLKSSVKVSSYKQIEVMNGTYIGYETKRFFLFSKRNYLTPSI